MYSVIDIGSNTIRLVIYHVEPNVIKPILNNKATVGLASYIKKNCLTKAGINKLISVLNEFKSILNILPDCKVYPFATASLRNIVNSDDVLDIVRSETGFEIEILSGYEEAMFDYNGAIRDVSLDQGLLVDVGGGSTELVFFKDKKVLYAHSIPIGSLNLYTNYVKKIIPNKNEVNEMYKKVYSILENSIPFEKEYMSEPIVAVGGTARASASLYKKLKKTDSCDKFYSVDFFSKLIKQIEDKPQKLVHDILKNSPERIHTFIPGIIILKCISELYESSTVVTSTYGVREGYLSYILDKGEQ